MATKTALLDIAERAVRSRGQNGFSFGDLSKAVGIKTASVHYHFPTKAALLTALIERYSASVDADLARLSTGVRAPSDRIKAFFNIYHDALLGGQGLCLCVAVALAKDDLPHEAQKALLAYRSMVLQWLDVTLEDAHERQGLMFKGDFADIAKTCLALAEGAQIAARVSGKVSDFDRCTAPFLKNLTPASFI